ncbi:hypothetical protein ACE193_11240 [Bernardetia sp. OM2101]|uniref:hypothetical protein n=1 Tax=Bernardetia sp. OM2101 TaxID=3344876 RepID=UPI0035CF4777
MEEVKGIYRLTQKTNIFIFFVSIASMLIGFLPYIYLVKEKLWTATGALSVLLIPMFVFGLIEFINIFYYKVIVKNNIISLKMPLNNRLLS